MNSLLERKLLGGLIIVTLMVGLAMAVIFHNSRQLSETQALVANTYHVQGELQRMLNLMVDVETGSRGFVVSGQDAFLKHFHEAQAGVGAQLRDTKELTSDNPKQQRQFPELERLVAEKLDFNARVLDVARKEGLEAGRQLVATGQGLRAMEALREVIANMQAEEDRLLIIRQARSQADDQKALWLAGGLAALMLAVVLGAYFLVRFHLTGRQRAEQELRRSEEYNRSIVESSSDCLKVLSTDGRLLEMPGPCRRLMEVADFEEIRNTSWLAFWKDEDAEAARQAVDAARNGNIGRFQGFCPTMAGTPKWWDVVVSPIRNSAGTVERLLAVSRDATERRQAEQALNDARLEADRANRAKSEFLSRMSHELRTPMNAILGFAQVMEMGDAPKALRVPISHIIKAGRHLLDLINEVLDIARIEAGRIEISVEPVHVGEVVEECMELIRPIANQRSIRLETSPDENRDRYVLADRQRLKQALLNLLSNAVKFNRDGGSVTLSAVEREQDRPDGAAAPGKRLRLNVADAGYGISAAELQRVFDPFERLNADARGIEGTGLGLALTKRLIELMGASISVESEEGRGSVFSLEFSLVQSPVLRSKAPEISTDAITPGPNGAHTVLYIEDNLSNLQLIEHVMTQRPGVKLLAAMQGSLGLDLAREHRPRLILLDLNLPDIPGREVLRRLRGEESTREIPVVVISADATPGTIQRLLSAGASDYLTKPLDLKKFLSMLDEHLQPGATEAR